MTICGLDEFLRKLPKIELHAHLNGSLRIESIRELGAQIYGGCTPEFLKLSQRFIEFDEQSMEHGFQKFKFMHELTATQRGLQLAAELVIRDFAADQVVYLELRTTPKANANMTKIEYLRCVLAAIEQSKQTTPDIIVKLLPSIDRAQPLATAEDTLRCVLGLRQEHPDTIVGLDLSGNPACGEFASFSKVLAQARQHGLRLTLHCGEIDNNEEIDEMLRFGMDRLGHGTFLSDTQLQEVCKRNIAVECCLTSNVKCGTVCGYADHHMKHLLALDGDVVLCTDDSGVFDTTLTNEFRLAAKYFELSSNDIRKLAINGVEHAFASDNEKTLLRQKLSQFFDENKI